MNKNKIVMSMMGLCFLTPSVLLAAQQSAENHHQSKARQVQVINTAVNINTATVKQLASLERVGASKAQAIIAYRNQNGKFKSIADLAKVKGISKKIIEVNSKRLKL